MLDYKFTPLALDDLVEIREYTVGRWGVLKANDYIEQIESTIKLLCEFPQLGKLNINLDSKYQSYPFESHIIFYMVEQNTIVIHGIIHQRMLPTRL
ncbi:type II toxin-antitoxin system RelE/ParE family toxin [Pseudidiomarina tainanensis]|uniref:Toxin n=2 Tax=Pseudidiomarina TaxID=2800384 RepID=A0A1I6GVS4_9GAMM|nr:type II toxin-antitoxin system RelE/ParE family toxin [Pseudidiomarina tainanensis]SFR46292.1 toxin ParE1/3/4 [Pseudidiomarina maritima]